MRERVILYVLGSAALIWPLAAHAQSTTQPTQGTAANSPRIEMVRVKLIDQNAPEPRFQLRDGVVDLTKGGFGFGGSDGIGATWKMRSSRSNEKGARRAAPRVCFRCPRSE
jgi:hypothetical protein